MDYKGKDDGCSFWKCSDCDLIKAETDMIPMNNICDNCKKNISEERKYLINGSLSIHELIDGINLLPYEVNTEVSFTLCSKCAKRLEIPIK